MKKVYQILMLAALVLSSGMLYAQGTVKGRVLDAETNDGLIGATVVVEGTTIGGPTDMKGFFEFEAPAGTHSVKISYVGFYSKSFDITVEDEKTLNMGKIHLDPSAIGLAGINIIADRAKERETPVAMSTLNKTQIEERLGSRDIPLVLNMTPSIYATAQGGGAGDARINVRGFNQRNVAIMINGIPVNDMENGWVYWSNWDGIGDATSSIQVQRGLSAVNLATPSIGGTMNIITSPAEQQAGGIGKFEVGSGNFMKATLTAHTGLINEKFAMSVSAVRKVGSGIINQTWTDAWAYYVGASYNINSKHRLEVYAMGAPQRHGQNIYRSNIATYNHEYAQSIAGYDTAAFNKFPERGQLFNQNWGSVDPNYTGKQWWNGKEHDRYDQGSIMERENYFHKPLANINWYAQWSEKVSLFTTVYYSGGKGGGTGTYGSIRYDYNNGDPRILDWNATIARNMESDTARGILRNSVNNQYTIGAISKLKVDWNENFKTVFGVDWRTASVDHFREVRDLLGGKFYIDNADEFNPNKKVVLGDKIAYDFTNDISWIGGFAQAEYHNENLTAYITLGISNIKYETNNRFLKDPDDPSKNLVRETDPFLGYQFKGGLSYNVSETWTLFGNAGYVSKVPILDAAINDNTGDLIEDPENETFISGELGVNYRSADGVLNFNANVYHTTWNDRTVNVTDYDNITDDEGIFTIMGLNAVHQGIELELAVQPSEYFRLDGAASVGNWRNTNNTEALYKEYGNPDADTTINVYAKDLRTGDAPQTQFALAGTVFPCKGLYVTIAFRHYANYWSDWNVVSRTDPDDIAQSWKIPSYSIWDLHAGYQLPMKGKTGVEIFGHVFNLFDQLYISDATDDSPYNGFSGAPSHTAANAEVFMGLPFSWNLGVKISIR
ncbi:MAG: TonB-dependent receptor [Bacteroidales bacterium]|jgi:outer membrane cobalamin receptor|nr:TonB-dependent receptor [Bacteroidales bacterium]